MSRLSLSLFGVFQAALNDEPITDFESIKGQALLAYLALEPDRSHSRLALAGLLWPERPDVTARNNLRHALYVVRRALGDQAAQSTEHEPFLLVTREAVQFNCASECWVDAHAFQALVSNGIEKSSIRSLADGVSLYRGHLLEGFYVSESPEFEDWVLLMRDRLQRQAATALRALVTEHTRLGDYESARRYAWRWVELEPWQEAAHRHLMRVLALSGRRTEALAQFEACCRTLQEEFDVEPSPATVRVFEQLRDGAVVPEPPTPLPLIFTPPPVIEAGPIAEQDTQPFVTREQELAQLNEHLKDALKGQGHVVFVTGEAGYGKTALMQAFISSAQGAHAHLVVLGGSCNAYTGVGDPYLPFREILAQVTGGGGAPAAQTWGDTRRLPGMLPMTLQALLDQGRDLIDVFVSATSLQQWANPEDSHYEWAAELREAIERSVAHSPRSIAQDDLFEQYANVVRSIAEQAPLVLVLDDLQWADLGSTSLLFHLGKRLGNSRILILGAYRPEEVALGRNGQRHPLTPVIHEFQRDWGDIDVDLHQAENRRFVTALLQDIPNLLGSHFEATLYEQTGGHALFTVELLRGMQERGDLIQDTEGRWIEGPRLNWDILPSRVEAVIAERMDRLPVDLRAMLRTACIQGEVFTAEVLARAHGRSLQKVIDSLSGDLDRRHRLVRAESVQQVAGRRISNYRFRHFLFQKQLYGGLDEVERVHLHEQVGTALAHLYAGSDEALASAAPQLAWHFEQAEMVDESIRYYEMAGHRAIRMLAYQEAIGHLERALELLERLPASRERDQREVALRLAIANPIMMLQSWGAPALVEHYGRAEALTSALDDLPSQLDVLGFVRMYYTVRADHRRSVRSSERFITLARQLGDPFYIAAGHTHLSIALIFVGDFVTSADHVKQMHAHFNREAYNALGLVTTGGDPEVATLSIASYNEWYRGYPDRALKAAQESMALAEDLGEPISVYFGLALKSRVHRWRHEVEDVEAGIQPLERTWSEYHMPMGMANALQARAWVFSERGHPEEGIPLYMQGLEIWDAAGMGNHLGEFYGVLAEMYGEAGQPDEGLRWIDDAFAFVERTDEHYHEAELYRLRGELQRLQDGDHAAAAADDFRRAIEIAQRQSARSLELRAAMSLCRLWRDQGAAEKLAEARHHLAEVYDWFTEGFHTHDLQGAKALLDAEDL